MNWNPSNLSRQAVLATAMLFFSVIPLSAQKGLDPDSLSIPHQTFVLDNGLTVIVHSDHSVPIVSVNLWYHVGSGKERRGRTGFAHLFEHFFFNGSENYPHGFREAMDDLGVNNRNGTTNTDRTNFFEDVPVSALERTLYLEADRMGFLAGNLSQEMLDRERGVVQNEKRQGENRPYGKAFGRIVESIYPYSHPYSWSTIGRMEDLDAASLEDINSWYSRFYGPDNCVLSLAGDITPEKALELVTTYFGAIEPGPPAPRYRSWVPELDRDIRDTMQDRVPQARIYRVYHLPPMTSPSIPHLELAADVLSGSRSARLNRALVYEDELVTDVNAFVWDKEIASNLVIIATAKQGIDPVTVEKEIDEILSTFLTDGPSQDELQRSKARFFRQFARQMERLGGFGGRSDILADSYTYRGSSQAYLDRLRSIASALPEDIKESSNRWLRAHHYTLTVEPFPELGASANTTLDRSILPALADPPAVSFPEIQSAELSNGLKVMLLERHSAPLINLTLVIDAGSAADPLAMAGTATLALQLMEEGGTTSRDAFTVVDELDALGASVSTASSLDLSQVRLRALPTGLEGALDIFADIILHPAFPQDMVAIGKKRQLARIEQEKARPRSAVLRIVPRLLYGEGHAYSAPLTGSGDPESVASMSRESLAQWHRRWFQPNTATLIVAGDSNLEEILPLVERAFGGWKPGTKPNKNFGEVEHKLERDAKIFLVDKPDAPQSVIVAAHLSRPGGQPDELAIETVVRNFGRMSTSRLNRNLRLDKHWSYGAFSLLLDARGPRPFVVVAPVQTDKTKESMIELTKEIEGIAGQRPIVGEEFESTMRNMLLRLPGRFETLAALEGAAEDLVNYGYPTDYFATYADRVRSLTEDDLASAAAEYIRPDDLIWVVIGDLAEIEAGIRELDYGEIAHLDTAGRLLEEN